MSQFSRFITTALCGLLAAAAMLCQTPAAACSRVLYKSQDGKFILVGRNMDWLEDLKSNLWIMPRGVKREGMAAKNSVVWTAKYGSLVVSGYDLGSTDGMNEKGLVGNLHWLVESEYGKRDESRPGLAVTQWLQFCLDQFQTVDEAVKYFEANNVQILPASVGETIQKLPVTVHLALADKSGDTSVIQVIGTKMKIYRGDGARVMTNSPPLDEQLIGLKKYKGFGGAEDLPGSVKAADRFVRAAYYLGRVPEPKDQRQAVAGVLSVMRNVAQPFGPASVDEPNTSATIWRTVADMTNGVYFFESSFSPNIIWVKLDQLDFTKSQKLDLVGNPDRVGDVTAEFKLAEPFKVLAPDTE
jgi:penicillin V acylase-like amidase (Ntn superfamily)